MMNGKQCELGEITEEIRKVMDRPIGIIVVGAGSEVEGDFKSRVAEELRMGLQGVVQKHFLGMPSLAELTKAMERPPSVIIVTLSSEHSTSCAAGRVVMLTLRKCGVKTTMILHAKCMVAAPKTSCFGLLRRRSRMKILQQQIQLIEESISAQKGVDYLVVAEEIPRDAREGLKF